MSWQWDWTRSMLLVWYPYMILISKYIFFVCAYHMYTYLDDICWPIILLEHFTYSTSEQAQSCVSYVHYTALGQYCWPIILLEHFTYSTSEQAQCFFSSCVSYVLYTALGQYCWPIVLLTHNFVKTLYIEESLETALYSEKNCKLGDYSYM